ncbi:MAG: TonB family protein [Zetaproteobacteria bacterium]|nr:MAG: TonB family protein [Zetaproteobacteria bacterium]
MQPRSEARRLGVSFTASLALHLLLALLLTYAYSHRSHPPTSPTRPMDVFLLDQHIKPQHNPPKDARTLSNRNATGGAKEAHDQVTRLARAPRPAMRAGHHPTPTPAAPAAPSVRKPPAPRPQRKGAVPAPRKHEPHPNAKSHTKPQRIPLNQLLPSSSELAQLSQRYQRARRMRQLNAREADIPINTREAKYAPYAQLLVRALEEQWRPGEADYNRYSADARQATIRLTIEKNGDLGGIEILRPSPIPEINESAIRAIHDAAPFRPLPRAWGLDRVSFYLTFEIINDRFVFHRM